MVPRFYLNSMDCPLKGSVYRRCFWRCVCACRQSLIGLSLALLGPAILAFISVNTSQINPGSGLLAQAVLVFLCICVLVILVGWERQTLSSIGFMPLRWI